MACSASTNNPGIRTGRDEWTVGQNTINFVVAILGAAIAILAILINRRAATADRPEYHESMLIMKMRATAATG